MLAARAEKQESDQLFEMFDAQDLNKELKNIMDGLSVKVRHTDDTGHIPVACG